MQPGLSRVSSREGLRGLSERVHLSKEPVESSDLATVLCYPRPEARELEARMHELASIGVDAIELSGTHQIGYARVIGKGTCVKQRDLMFG